MSPHGILKAHYEASKRRFLSKIGNKVREMQGEGQKYSKLRNCTPARSKRIHVSSDVFILLLQEYSGVTADIFQLSVLHFYGFVPSKSNSLASVNMKNTFNGFLRRPATSETQPALSSRPPQVCVPNKVKSPPISLYEAYALRRRAEQTDVHCIS